MEYWIFSNNANEAKQLIDSGVTHICVDLEHIGKVERQKSRDTLISKHSIYDILKISELIGKERTICRINPIHVNTKSEIEAAISNGARSIILPYFKTVKEVSLFIELVNKKAKTIALLETPQALIRLPEIVKLSGLDHIHIGLNDLSIGLGFEDMFEVVRLGWMEQIANTYFSNGKITFGFGGVSALDDPTTRYPARDIISHHVRSNSKSVILSRGFFKYCQVKSSELNTSYWSTVQEEMKKIDDLISHF